MVRHDDEWWMNHRNTYGRLTYVKDAKRYETPEEKEVTPRMPGASGPPGETASDARPDAVRPGAQYAQLAVPMPGPVPVPMPVPPIPQGQGTAAADAVWRGIKGLKPADGETVSDYLQRPLYNLGIKKGKNDTKADSESNVRVSGTGNCTPEQHRDLQNRLENACGAANSCRGGDAPEVLSAKIAAHYACIRARQKINETCFNGGDQGHNDAIRQRYDAIAKCWKLGGGVPKNERF